VVSGLIAYRFAPMKYQSRKSQRTRLGLPRFRHYFEVLGVQPFLGRHFAPEEDKTPGSNPVAVISYGYWQKRLLLTAA